MKRTILLIVSLLSILGAAQTAYADVSCKVYVNGTLKDPFSHTLYTASNDLIDLGEQPDSFTCVTNAAYFGVADFSYAVCSYYESGTDVDMLGTIFVDDFYTNGYYLPSCNSVGLNFYTALASETSLNPGDYILSPNGNYKLIYQTDGNLVVYHISGGTTAIWAGNCWPTCHSWGSAGIATMQYDGNFVVYNSDPSAVWASATDVNWGAFVVLTNTGEIVVYTTSGDWLWSNVRGHHH